MTKVNLKFIGLHFLGIILMIGAFENLAVLYNLDLGSSVQESGYENGLRSYSESKNMTQGEAVSNLLMSTQTINLLGLIIGTAASVFMAKKLRISLINSGVLFLIGFLLVRFEISNYLQFQSIFSRPDISLIAAALILTLISFGLFFSKWTNSLIRS